MDPAFAGMTEKVAVIPVVCFYRHPGSVFYCHPGSVLSRDPVEDALIFKNGFLLSQE